MLLLRGMGSLKDFGYNKKVRLQKDLFLRQNLFLFYFVLLCIGIHLLPSRHLKAVVPEDGVMTWSLLLHDKMVHALPSNSNRQR